METSTSSKDPEPLAPRPRIVALDGMRGIAVSMIIVLHSWALMSVQIQAHALDALWIAFLQQMVGAMDFFYVLSGYLIGGILLRTRLQPGQLRRFFARRALRILPLHVLVVLLVLVALRPIAGHWLWYLSFLTNWKLVLTGVGASPYLNHLWSLAIEEQVYLVLPIFVIFVPSRHWTKVAVGLVMACAIARTAAIGAGYDAKAVSYVTFFRLDAFAAGCAFAAARHHGKPRNAVASWPRFRALGALGMAGAVLGQVILPAHLFLRGVAPMFNIAVALGFLAAATIAPERAVLRRVFYLSPLQWLGRRSYAIYLFHQPLFFWFGAGLVPEAVASRGVFVVSLFVLATLAPTVFALAQLVYVVIERPIERWKERNVRAMETGPFRAIVIVPTPGGGHHLLYARTMTRVFRERGLQVIVVYPPAQRTDYAPAEALGAELVPFPVVARRGNVPRLSTALSYFEQWRSLHRAMSAALARRGNPRACVVFSDFEWTLPEATRRLGPIWLGLAFPRPWLAFVMNATGLPPQISRHFASPACLGVVTLHDELRAALARIMPPDVPGEKLLVVPDFTDLGLGEGRDQVARRVTDDARGRFVVALVGALHERKNLETFFFLVARADPRRFHFVLAGEITWSSLSLASATTLRAWQEKAPENVTFVTTRLASDDEINAVILVCDLVFVPYRNYPLSSNLVVKAAALGRPALVPRGSLMARLVGDRALALEVDETSAAEALDALEAAAARRIRGEAPSRPSRATIAARAQAQDALATAAFAALLTSIERPVAAKPRILFISDDAPLSPMHGGRQRTHAFLTELKKHGDVVEHYESKLEPSRSTASARLARLPMLVAVVIACGAGLNPGAYFRWLNRRQHAKLVAKRGALGGFDLIVCRYYRLAKELGITHLPHLVVDCDDLALPPATSIKGRMERSNLRRCRGLTFVSRHEILDGLDPRRCVLQPNLPHDPPGGAGWRPEASRGEEILFVGMVDHPPIREGLQHFVRQAWPRVLAQFPRATLVLAGRGDWAEFARLTSRLNLRVVGAVERVDPLYQAAAFAIAPTLHQVGSAIKVVEAFAHGRTVVATEAAFRAFAADFRADRALLVGADAEGMAAHCAELLRDEALRRQLETQALADVRGYMQRHAYEVVLGRAVKEWLA